MKSTLRLSVIAIAAAAGGCASFDSTSSRTAEAPPATSGSMMRVANTQSPMEVDMPLLGPADAKPGQCFAKVFVPARYETRDEEVVKTAATERIEIVPAQIEEVQEQVIVRPATTRLEVVPAVYETVEEQVEVTPERTVIEEVPAVYETVTEQVLVKPAVWAWKRASEGASSDITRVDAATGDVLCLVEIPAQYESVTKQVVKTPATTRERTIPAEFKTVTRQVLKTPATTREVQVPAEYETVTVRKVVNPAAQRTVAVPAEYETVQRTVLAETARSDWRQVLCEVNATDATIRAMQDQLREAGFDPGPSTGDLNEQTLQALHQYQAANGLPVDRGAYVNIRTAEALGVTTAQAPASADMDASEASQ